MNSRDLTRPLADVAGLLGLVSFKDKQDEALRAFLSGRDTFVSLPTGYGKSVIYAALPLICDRLQDRRGSIAVCVSPLTSLMIDQRSKFARLGISTEFVGELQHISIYVYNSYRAIDIRSSHKAYSLLYIYSYMLTHCYWRRFG